jgi:spermidine/putrescine transport system permease protein
MVTPTQVNASPLRGRNTEWPMTAPSFLWLVILFAIPTLWILAMSFRQAGPYGGFGEGWTLDAWIAMAHPAYPAILWRTIWLSAAATGICLAIALPVGWFLAKVSLRWRNTLILLVILPFWTNFLIRIYAWKVLLHPEAFLRKALIAAGIIDPRTLLLYHEGAVLLVLVYAYLPFAILPVYAAAEKFDFSLIDAARDLGASAWRAFWRIFVPGVSRGIFAAVAMVLIPALGSYIIPDLVGGPAGEMIGNKIAQRVFVDRDWPQAAALGTVLMALTLLPVMGFFLRGVGRRKASGKEAVPL